MNYFTPESAAERYWKGCPYFHRNTVDHIRRFLKLGNVFGEKGDWEIYFVRLTTEKQTP